MAEYAVPVILAVATSAYSGISAHQKEVSANKQAREARAEAARNLARWEQASKPDPEALKAQAIQSRGQAGQARLGAYQNLASNLAARGFGAGSGIGAKGAAGIERGYLQNLGQASTELTKFGLTSQFAPPGQAYSSAAQYGGAPSGWQAATGTGANLMGTAYGWNMMKSLYGDRPPPQGTPASYYDPNDPYVTAAFKAGPSYGPMYGETW